MKQLIFIALILIVGCQSEKSVETITKTEYKQNPRLISCSSKFVMEDSEEADGYYDDHKNFLKPYFSTKYKSDTIEITSLMLINACGKTIGDIKFNSDSLFLFTKHVSDEACTSQSFTSFSYVIYNPENIKYVVNSKQ